MALRAEVEKLSVLSTGSPPTTTSFALVRAAGITLAVRVDEVVQALPLNGLAAHVPRTERALVGVVQHRGQVIPVVDLSCWGSLQSTADAATHTQVLVLQKGTRSTGIAIECTVGIVATEEGAVQRVHHDNSPRELFHSVLTVDGYGQPVPLLSTDHLLQQTDVWTQSSPAIENPSGMANTEAPLSPQISSRDAVSSHTDPYVVVELDGLRFALPVEAVGTLMPTPAIQKLPSLTKGLQGVFAWGKRNIPVVRIHHELRLALPPRDTPHEAWLLVVRTQSEALGILVNHFVGVQRFESRLLQPAHTPLGVSVVPDPDGGQGHSIQLISAAALFKALPMSAIGAEPSIETQSSGASASRVSNALSERPAEKIDVSPEAHVIFQAGRTMATPLKALLEIVMNDPPGVGAANSPPTHYSWRGKLVPMIDLRLVMEGVGCAAGSDARVLIVKVADRLTAVLVESVIDLVPAFVGTLVTLQMNHSRSIKVLTTDVGGKPGSYEILDVGCQIHHP